MTDHNQQQAATEQQINEVTRVLYRDANLCGQGRADHLPRRSIIIEEANAKLLELFASHRKRLAASILDDIYKAIPPTYIGSPDYIERTADEWREIVAGIAAYVQDYDGGKL